MNDNLVEPPWVYGPTEVNRWINSVYPTKKEKKDEISRKPLREKLVLEIKLKKSKREIGVIGRIIKRIGLVEEEVEVTRLIDILIRGFHASGFKNLVEMKLDGERIYYHPERQHDSKKIMEYIEDKNYIEARFSIKTEGDTTAYTSINKYHRRWKPLIKVLFKNKVEIDRIHRFLNYIMEHLDIEVEIK